MTYDPVDMEVKLVDPDGKEHIINGFADSDMKFLTQWYTVDEEVPYKIRAICKNGNIAELTFTPEAYAKYIEPLEPSIESPFDCKVIEQNK